MAKAFDPLRQQCLLETKADHLLHVLEEGTVSTNVYLHRLHNFAVDMSWLPWPVLPKRRWPAVRYKQKRAITQAEHEAILGREPNPERTAFYQLAWHLGSSQTDIALLLAENIDWNTRLTEHEQLRATARPPASHIPQNRLPWNPRRHKSLIARSRSEPREDRWRNQPKPVVKAEPAHRPEAPPEFGGWR